MTRRLFIDVTRTRASPHHSGIQKVVRGLYRALDRQAGENGFEIVPVVLTPRGPVAVPALPVHPFERGEDLPPGAEAAGVIRLSPGRLDRLRKALLLRSQTSRTAAAARSFLRAAARVARAPAALKDRIAPPPLADIAAGDILLMPDTAWQIDPWPAVARFRRAGGRIAAIWYDLIPLSHPEHFHPELPGPFRAYFERMLKEADLIIAISAAVEAQIAEWAARLGRTPPPLAHAWPGARLAAPAPRRPEIAAVLARPTVLIVATLEPRKGHALLLDACERLWERGCDFNLLIAGRTGWQVEALARRLAGHPLRGRSLHHFDDLGDGEIVDLYNHAAVTVVPSIAEGFGLPVVEAELAGCATLVSDIPVFREIASPATRFFRPRTPEALAEALAPFVTGAAARTGPARDAAAAGFARHARDVLGHLDRLASGDGPTPDAPRPAEGPAEP